MQIRPEGDIVIDGKLVSFTRGHGSRMDPYWETAAGQVIDFSDTIVAPSTLSSGSVLVFISNGVNMTLVIMVFIAIEDIPESVMPVTLRASRFCDGVAYLWLVGNRRMVVIVVVIVPHSSIPY